MFEEKLITAIQKREIIYNKKSMQYRLDKSKIWLEISEEVGQTGSLPLLYEAELFIVNTCKGRWKSLRDRFVREYVSKPSGSAAYYKPKWEYYDNLLFLKDHITPRKTSSNLNSSSDDANSGSIDPEISICLEAPFETNFLIPELSDVSPLSTASTSSSPIIPQQVLPTVPSCSRSSLTPRKRTRRERNTIDNADEKFSCFLEKIEKIISHKFDSSKNSNESFLEILSEKLNLLPNNVRETLKMKILNMVFDSVAESQAM